MPRGLFKWLAGIAVTAFANCVAGHVVDCMFEAVGLSCPRRGTA
jgi:hypothetical protein